MKKMRIIKFTVLALAIAYVCFGMYVVVASPTMMPKLLSCVFFLLGLLAFATHLALCCVRALRYDRRMTERRRDYENSKAGL